MINIIILIKVKIESYINIISKCIVVEVIETEQMDISPSFNNQTNGNIITETQSNKRKHHATPTASQRSISHPLTKRIKKNKPSQIRIASIKPNYRLPIYLKVHPNLLFRTLRLQLKHSLKKKNERRFLHHRLQLLDQQCRLILQQNLWQSYLTLGSEHQSWPVSSIRRLSKRNSFNLLLFFLIN